MLDQQSLVISPLAVSHPDFTTGLAEGRECFYDVYGPGELPTAREVVRMIEENLSPQALAREQIYAQVVGLSPLTPAYRMGFLVSWLDTYVAARGARPVPELPNR